MPASAAEIDALSWSEMKFIFAISHAQAIQAFADQGEEALRSELTRWDPRRARRWHAHSQKSPEERDRIRKLTNSAGVTGATPIPKIGRLLSMSSCVIGGSKRLVVRLEHNPAGLLIDELLDEEEKSADVDVLPLRSPRQHARSRISNGRIRSA